MIEFYHNIGTDMLKLGFTLPNLASYCSHESTDSKVYSFTKTDKDLFDKLRELWLVDLPVTTRKAVVETFIQKSTNLCKSLFK